MNSFASKKTFGNIDRDIPVICGKIETFGLVDDDILVQQIQSLKNSGIDVLYDFKQENMLPDDISLVFRKVHNSEYLSLLRLKLVLNNDIRKDAAFLKFKYLSEMIIPKPKQKTLLLQQWKKELQLLSIAFLLQELLKTSPQKQYALLNPVFKNERKQIDYSKLQDFVKQELREGNLQIEKQYLDQLQLLSSNLAIELSQYQNALSSIRSELLEANLHKGKLYKKMTFDKNTIKKLIKCKEITKHQCINNFKILFMEDESAMKFLDSLLTTDPSMSKKSCFARLKSFLSSLSSFFSKKEEEETVAQEILKQ